MSSARSRARPCSRALRARGPSGASLAPLLRNPVTSRMVNLLLAAALVAAIVGGFMG
ncbi:hypothetical protein [Rhodoligotrophos defluvii]|uniref:hypothetical protein n=1 Tax=Rhodoligotrophos defluvii TaxID=2561934 RepID=UPI001484D540|nr:hypothetical protein [Rhodoligotrophos defluvii]